MEVPSINLRGTLVLGKPARMTKYVQHTIRGICAISATHVYWPRNKKEYKEIMEGFSKMRAGFPMVIGCTDGCHIEIPEVAQGSTGRALDWLYRKGYYSMLLQGTFVTIGSYSRISTSVGPVVCMMPVCSPIVLSSVIANRILTSILQVFKVSFFQTAIG